MRITVSIITLLAISHYGVSQTAANPMTDTIKWEYRQIKNLNNDELVSLNGHFISYGAGKLEWIQEGYGRQYSFAQNSRTGEWTDVTSEGSLTYAVQYDDMTGTLRISTLKEQTTIEVNFQYPDKKTPHLLLFVSAVTKI